MTPSDPYQKSFATVEELLSNPRGRVRQNPSKAYETIVAAVKASDGHILPWRSGLFAYVVLSGPMTGTYILGQKFNRYKPDFEEGFSFRRTDLRLKIVKVLKPLYNVIHATGLGFDKHINRRRKSIDQTKAEILQLIEDWRDDENLPDALAMLDDFTADPKGFTKKRHDNQITAAMVRSPSFKMAERL